MICNSCERDKPEDAFAFRADVKRYRRTCRACTKATHDARIGRDAEGHRQRERERARRQRREHPEINRRAHAKWRAAHLDHARALQKRYRQTTGANQLRRWRERNREHYNAYMRRYRLRVSERISDWSLLMDAVAKLISNHLPPHIKDDIFQECMCRLVERPTLRTADKLKELVDRIRKQVVRENDLKYRTISIDVPLSDEGGATMADLLPSLEPNVEERLIAA